MSWMHQPRPNVRSVKPTRELQFRDINCDYGTDTDPLIVVEDTAIRKQIRNLLGTPLGTDDLEPNYGSDVPYRIMDPIGAVTAYLLETDTIVALARWMTNRIRLRSPGCRVEELSGEDGYLVSIPYQRKRDGGTSEYQFEILR